VGAWFLQSFTRGNVDARAVQAYELAAYPPGVRPDDLVLAVSHSGTTTMTLHALERVQELGAETVALTGFPDSPAGQLARHVLPSGYSAELSWAHTASYTAALTSLAALANALAGPEERLDLSPLPSVMADALQLEEMAHRLAASVLMGERYHETSRIVLTGAGANASTAQEGALKILETSYCPATAFELEEMLHGPLAAVTPDTLLILLAPPGKSTERAAELARAARAIGTVPVALVGSDNANAFEDAHRFLMPDAPEVLTPLAYVVPLQLFSYFLSVGRGLNPDLLHRDDERYRVARAMYT
jgi:glucosamine--fructose-6-phosphate aminotransferase (isomerizing)